MSDKCLKNGISTNEASSFDFDSIAIQIEDSVKSGQTSSEFIEGIVKASDAEKKILPEIDYKAFLGLGLKKTKDIYEQILELRTYFGIRALTDIPRVSHMALRRGRSKNFNSYALAGWLRKGEVEAWSLDLPAFCRQKLEDAVPKLRALSYKKPDSFFQEATRMLHNAGVGMIGVKNPKNTSVFGAARMIGDKTIMQVSDYQKRYDLFWFTLFHEIGHLLLHDIQTTECIFFGQDIDAPLENEANEFASDTLIDKAEYGIFVANGDFSLPSISDFANRVKAHRSIVCGRLAYDKHVEYPRVSSLRDGFSLPKPSK